VKRRGFIEATQGLPRGLSGDAFDLFLEDFCKMSRFKRRALLVDLRRVGESELAQFAEDYARATNLLSEAERNLINVEQGIDDQEAM
jgi:hypothetical protein